MLRRVFKKKTPLKKVQKDVRFLKRAIEIKQIDTVSWINHNIPSFVGSNDSLNVVNMVIPGNTYTQRVGNKIAMKDLRIRLEIAWIVGVNRHTNNQALNAYRLVVIYDKYSSQANGQGVPTTTPAWNTIFQDRQSNGTTLQGFLAGKNNDLGDRFVMLYDKVRHVVPVLNPLTNSDPPVDQPAAIGIPYHEDVLIPLKGKQTCFNVNEITEGALYIGMIAMHNYSMVSDNVDNYFRIVEQHSRLRYYDI